VGAERECVSVASAERLSGVAGLDKYLSRLKATYPELSYAAILRLAGLPPESDCGADGKREEGSGD
jgi:hypothetical protein